MTTRPQKPVDIEDFDNLRERVRLLERIIRRLVDALPSDKPVTYRITNQDIRDLDDLPE